MHRRLLVSSVALLLAASTAGAQSSGRSGRQTIELLPQVVSINPLLLPFGGLIAEYEAVAAPNVTFGASLAYYDFVGGGSDRYTSGEAKVRFYPGERAPEGFAVGLTLGFGRSHDGGVPPGEDATKGGLTSGVAVDYHWLVGPSRRFFIGSGVAVKRRFGDLRDDWIGWEVLPTARLQMGVVF